MRFHEIAETSFLNNRSSFLLLFVGFLLTTLQFITNYFSDVPPPGLLTVLKGDVVDYLALSENFLKYGNYGFNENTPSYYRMPGFAFFYLPFRFLFEKNMAINFLVVFQVLFSVLAKYLFSKIVLQITKSKVYFVIAFLILTIGSPLIFRNNILYVESLASSCMMLSLYFLFSYDVNHNIKNLFFAGFFTALMIFLRPFTGIMIPIVFLYLFFKGKQKIGVLLLKQNLAYILVFLVFQVGWVTRNFTEFNSFIPLEGSLKGTYCNSSSCAWKKLVLNTGESVVYWNDKTLGTWFINDEYLKSINVKRPSDSIVPKILLTKILSIDTLKKARDLSNGVYDEIYGKSKAEKEAVRIFSMFDDSLRLKNPFTYYVYSRLTPVYDTFFQPGSPTKNLIYPLNVLTNFFNTITSFLVLSIGFFSSLYLLYIKDNFFLRLLGIFNVVSIIISDVILRDHENRYILLNYGILVLSIIYTFHLSRFKIPLMIIGTGLSIYFGFYEVMKMF